MRSSRCKSRGTRIVTVEGIPAPGKAVLFAEPRKNGGLGRSVRVERVPPASCVAPATTGVLWPPRRGTSSRASELGPSLGPETPVLTSWLAHASHADGPVGLGQPRSRGRNRGRCVRRRTAKASSRHGASSQGERHAKEEGRGPRPGEDTRARGLCPYVVFRCRSRQATSGLVKPTFQPPKRGVGAGERGPSKTRERDWFKRRFLSGASRRDDRDPVRVASTAHARRMKAQGGARASSGGSRRRESVPRGSWWPVPPSKDMGRSLRRVPDDGRHSGSSRIVLLSRGERTRRSWRAARVAPSRSKGRERGKTARDGSVRGSVASRSSGRQRPRIARGRPAEAASG